MAKLQKTSAEIAALVMGAARKVPECEGLTGVTIQPINDDRVDFNWEVSHLHNNTTNLCQVAIKTIVNGAQRVIDLDLRTELTAVELAGIIAVKSGERADSIDVYAERDGWAASLKAGPAWTQSKNAIVKLAARALAMQYRLR